MMDVFYWFTPWEESIIVVIAISIVAILFLRGCVNSKPSFPQKLYFWTGLILIYLVSHTQFDYYSQHQFFIHRLQHLVLHHLGPFLIVLSSPLPILLSGVPKKASRFGKLAVRWKPLQLVISFLCNPILAVMLFSGLIGFWLLPSIHFTVMIDWRLYRLMNWSMLINGLIFWGLVLNPTVGYLTHLLPGTRIAMMLAVIPPQIVIGAMIFFASEELYPIYTVCGRAIGGLNAVEDQQIGGIILWIHGAMMSAAGILIVIRKELMSHNSYTKSQTG
ncbi:putative membrane protein [Nitrosomonas cryotolerans]|uniref:Putative membrane protein n=1 Tax=Nitrosomonas cryotolerans ATCC 49181 TaxID=1131553 RepID=A0A1N6JKX0_9PROT|nr:cytochrome c oxidase assembly protein [Nitrosomonas cryotolerans]SFQ00129.1 putative membrane protein [Nitrosomonas cryotolerans]SIO44817.1 putative membrane protein [Nitrosomonas cryotolerans ATCC 49181]